MAASVSVQSFCLCWTFVSFASQGHTTSRHERGAPSGRRSRARVPVWFLYIRFPHSTMETSKTPTKPVKVFRLRGLSASIFANRAKNADRAFPYFKVSLQRTYKDEDGFKTTSSFSRDDLPIADLLLKRAWAYILETEEGNRKDASETEEEPE